jgi:hypothetical protein
MRTVVDEEQVKRVGSSMELKQVHSHTDDDDVVELGPKFDSATFEDDDEDLEDIIAAAHHRFEDDTETVSLLSASSSSLMAEQGMTQSPQGLTVSRLSF